MGKRKKKNNNKVIREKKTNHPKWHIFIIKRDLESMETFILPDFVLRSQGILIDSLGYCPLA